MKKLIKFLLTLVLFIPTFSFAQQCPTNTSLVQPWSWPAHSNWYFGDGNIHNFNTGVTTNSNAYDSYEGVSSVSDDQGNLLFYTNGRNLWDSNGNLTSNALLEGNEGGGTGPVGSAAQGVITIRHPFAPDDYYVLTTDDALGATLGLNYVIVGKDGQVKSGPTRLGGFRTTEGIAATLHDNGLDVWVTVQVSGTKDYYTYLLTCSGFDSNPVISNVGPPGVVADKERGGLAFSPDGSKFVQGHPDYWPNSGKEVTIYDFDNLTGDITNPIDIASTQTGQNPYDITFSTDGQMVYFTQAGTGTIWSIDVSSGVKATMVASLTNTGLGGGGFSAIEIGPDGQIYTGGGSATSMGGNNLGTSDFGLPTMYIPPADSVEIQPVGNIQICDLPLDLSTLWYCKNSDAENTPRYENAYSMELSAGQHTLNSINGNFNTSVPGQYRVRFQICDIWDTLTFNIEDCETCGLKLKQDVEICLGETLLLDTLFKERSYGGDWSIDSFPVINSNNMNYPSLNKGIDTIFDASDLSTRVGTYKLSYTINNEGLICKDSIYVTINDLAKPDLGEDDFICFGGYMNIEGGDYNSFDWLPNGEKSREIYISTGGEYIVNVVDLNGCPGSDTININVIDLPKPDVLSDASFCPSQRTHTFDVSSFDNGNGSFNYLWNDGTDKFNLTTNPMTSSNVAGHYWVEITDKYGCSGRDSAVLTLKYNLDPLIDGYPLVSICENDSVTLISNYQSSNGYNFNWSTGEITESIVVKESGNYRLDVNDGFECEGSTFIEIIVNTIPIVSNDNDSICEGEITIFGDYLLDNFNDYYYLWEPSGGDEYYLEVDKTGEYKRTVTTDKGCVDSSVYTLVVNDLPIIDLGNDTSICEGDSVLINAGGDGLSYNWNSGDTTSKITAYTNMKYILEVTNIYGCKNIDSVLITVDTLPVLDLGPDTSICSYQTIELDAGNILSNHLWYNGSVDNIITVSGSGGYSVVVTNSFNCSVSDTIIIGVNEPPIVNLGNDTSICSYDTITFDALVGVSWKWDDNNLSRKLTVNESGDYSVLVTDINGCVGNDTISLVINEPPIVNLGNDTSICVDSLITFDALVGVSWKWDDNNLSRKLTVNESGDYDVVVTDINGCVGYDTISLSINELPVVNLGNDTSICVDSVITFDALVGVDWLWSSGDLTKIININESNDYDVVVTDINGCVGYDTISLSINELPIVDLGDNILVCDETPVNLTVNSVNGYSYKWNSGETTNSISPIVGGDYQLSVTDINNCVGYGQVYVEFVSNPLLDLGDDITICDGDVVILKSNSQFTTTWSTGSVGDTIMVNQSGSFVSTISNGICSDTDTVNVTVIGVPSSDIDKSIENDLICFDDYENGINLNTGGDSRNDYLWNTGETTSDINVYKGGSYDVTISDDICSISDTVVIKAYCPPSFYIPNAFTPNGDDMNNTFFAKSRNIVGFNILIFDRWGMLIFESDNVFQHWDGTFKGRPVQQDVYVWKICYSYYGVDGPLVEKNRIGTVTVIR